MIDDLKEAIERANVAAHDLGMLAEMMDRNEPDAAKRAALIHVAVSVGEFRDRLHTLKLDMQRAGLIDG